MNIATTYRKDIDEHFEKGRNSSGIISNDQHSKVTPEELSCKWNIGIQTAKDTLNATTHHGVHTSIHPMTRQLCIDHLLLNCPRLKGTWYVDTFISRVKSKLGNLYANVFTQGKFTCVVQDTKKSQAKPHTSANGWISSFMTLSGGYTDQTNLTLLSKQDDLHVGWVYHIGLDWTYVTGWLPTLASLYHPPL